MKQHLLRPTPLRSMPAVSGERVAPFVSFLRRFQCASAIAALVLQCVISTELQNIGGALILTIGSCLGAIILLRQRTTQGYIISSFSIWATFVTTVWGPLIFTTLEWKPVIFRLSVPIETFTWSVLLNLGLLLGHWIYRKTPAFGINKLRDVWGKIGLQAQPSFTSVWICGLLGFGACWYIYVNKQVEFHVDRDIGLAGRLIQAFTPLVVMPFYSIYQSFFGGRERKASKLGVLLVMCYVAALILLGIFSNTRALFAGPLFTCILAYILLGFSGAVSVKLKHLKILALTAPALILASTQIADLAMAMRFARSVRGSGDASEVARSTWEIFKNKEELSQLKEELIAPDVATWNEYYVDNPLASRLLATPFVDNSLVLVKSFGPAEQASLWGITIQQLLSIFPAPIRAHIPIEGTKEAAANFSMGDYFYFLAYGILRPDFKGGSMIAHGVALFGPLFPLVIALCAVPVFIFFDSFTYVAQRLSKAAQVEGNVGAAGWLIMPLALVCAYDFFVFWSVESLSVMFVALIRGYLQRVMIYAILLFVIQRDRRPMGI